MTAAIEELPSSEPSAAPGVNGSDADDAELAAREAAWVEELSAAEEWDAEVARLVKAEQVAEGIDEDFDDHSPKDWQRFYMGYHQVDRGPRKEGSRTRAQPRQGADRGSARGTRRTPCHSLPHMAALSFPSRLSSVIPLPPS